MLKNKTGLKHILAGAGSVLQIMPRPKRTHLYMPRRVDSDWRALEGDMRMTMADFRSAVAAKGR